MIKPGSDKHKVSVGDKNTIPCESTGMLHPLLLRRIQIFTATFILILVHGSNGAAQSPFQAKIQFVPPPPPTIGVPREGGRGAGSRGPACKRYENVTALVPFTKTKVQTIQWGLTTVKHPTVWFYAPQGLAANIPLEFVLQDEAGQNRFRTVVQTSNVPKGVFSLSLPATADPLQLGKLYRWSISIYCDPEALDIPITVEGNVKRIALSNSVQNQLAATQSILEQANLYATEGVWYDALTTLGESLRQSEGSESIMAWKDLLQQANLGDTARATIVPCCTIVKRTH